MFSQQHISNFSSKMFIQRSAELWSLGSHNHFPESKYNKGQTSLCHKESFLWKYIQFCKFQSYEKTAYWGSLLYRTALAYDTWWADDQKDHGYFLIDVSNVYSMCQPSDPGLPVENNKNNVKSRGDSYRITILKCPNLDHILLWPKI